MNILSVNKFYYPKGGCETYFFTLNQALQEKGYSIIPFSMKDGRNVSTPYESYFVDCIDYYDKSILKRLKYAAKIIYSREAKKKISSLISSTKPELAHLHNFYHQLSPSILKEIKKYGLPIVFTAHDLKLICPDYQMLNKGEICEKCKDKKYYSCALSKCMKDSFSASLVNTAEMYLHSWLKSYDAIDIIITPSEFYRKKFIEFGYNESRIVHIPNFVDTESNIPCHTSYNYVVFAGRLSKEKGILTLVKAMKSIKSTDLYIVGDGPLKSELESLICHEGLSNIKLLGYKTGKELREIMQNSRFTILPSEWYENSPLSVFESMSFGKAVIGADIGGIPELIEHEKTGMIFKSRNYEQLADQINYLISNPKKAQEMGKEARIKAELEFGKEQHFEKVERVYQTLLKKTGTV